jgi:hypothetical protein
MLIVSVLFTGLHVGWAQSVEPKTFAVLPCQIQGPKQYRYLSKGIQSMLLTRLTWEKHFEPLSEKELKDISQPESIKQAQNQLKSIEADYLIWELVTIVDNQTSFDLHMVSRQGQHITKAWQGPLDQLIPSLEEISQELNAEVFKKPTDHKGPLDSPNKAREKTLNPHMISNEAQRSQKTGLNPQFDYTETGSQGGRWRSQALDFSALAMVVCDADSDGTNEIFILDEKKIRAYRINDNRLEKLTTYTPGTRIKSIYINVLDLNRDGYHELLVSALEKNALKSYILNFREAQFIEQEKDIPFYLNVVKRPPEYMKTLIGQKRSDKKLFDGDVHELIKARGKYTLGRSVPLPHQAHIFNFTYLPQQHNKALVIIADSQDHLKVCSQSGEILFTSDTEYAASGNKLLLSSALPGLEGSPKDPKQFYYIPTRLIPCNLDRDSRYELLVNRNISVASQFFQRYRFFPQSSIHNLYWDGVGLNISWKTRSIKGSVVDYGLADINNNDTPDLYVCLNTHPGATGFRDRKTIVLSYPLHLNSKEQKGHILHP